MLRPNSRAKVLARPDQDDLLPAAREFAEGLTTQATRSCSTCFILCWLDYFPCYGRRNSLFWSLGNLPVSAWIPSATGTQSGSLSPHFVKFPVNFPVSREFHLETASILTASATTQSQLALQKSPLMAPLRMSWKRTG